MSKLFNMLKSKLLSLKKMEAKLEKKNLRLEREKKHMISSLRKLENGLGTVTKQLDALKSETAKLEVLTKSKKRKSKKKK